jgi:ribulose-phosphate 3-epimerase
VIKIAPSVLSADFSRLPQQIREAVDAGCDWLHLDVMDGHFVPNLTFGPLVVEGVRKLTNLPLDVHLMIENADDYLSAFKEAGANNLTVHYEACPHLWRTIDAIHDLGMNAGVTLNPATPISLIEPVLGRVDLVLVMTVEPGFGGQEFIEESIEKISYLKRIRQMRGLQFEVEVDGGIDKVTTPAVVKAGATVLVAGSAIFASDDIKTAINEIRKVAIESQHNSSMA